MVSYDTDGRDGMASISQIQDFLNEIRKADSIAIVPREKNKKTRYKIGLFTYDQIDIIINLTVKDYYKGPERDKDPTKDGDVWIFKSDYYEHVLYIKLKIKNCEDGKTRVVCISCHLDNME